MFYNNGNVNQTYPKKEKTVDYNHAIKLTKIKFKDGLVSLKDPETLIKFYPDGTQVIAHVDGKIKVID